MISRRFCVAPMMEYTDRHERYFLRLLSSKALLYTEMLTTRAILNGDRDYLLGYNKEEHPIAIQLGGSDPTELAQCARISEDYGYDEVNLNVGCPSDRVKSGQFGASLMAHPSLVAECVHAMKKAVSVPVTVKCRIGIDDMDSYDDMRHFVDIVAEGGCQVFIVHARKAWLQGLSPKENREIPPLRYEDVYRLKQERKDLEIIINGGITDLTQVKHHLEKTDGVMLGRAAYHNPYLLAEVDQQLYGVNTAVPSRSEILHSFYPYLQRQLDLGIPLNAISRHLLGLFQGVAGARAWRRYISENAYKKQANVSVLETALSFIESD
ncbi:MAG: tRNA dihydrouridine(20/20a) synthase DusA [Gammaproteobacteria bacterium]|nr:tRNA dihydrouridine(20/20a) synthase DusA [Gammaproteobacteria bacterium]